MKRIMAGFVVVMLLLSVSGAALADAPKAPAVQNILASARRLRDQKKWDESARACEQVIALQGVAVAQKLDAYDVLIDVCRRQKDLEKALATAVRIGTEMPDHLEAQVRSLMLQGDLNVEMGRKAEALTHYAAAVQKSDNPRVRQACLIRIGAIHASDNQTDEALAAFERIFTETSGGTVVMDSWSEAQHGIVDALRKANRFPEALQAARICLNAAPDANSISANTTLVASIFKDMDKNVTRANAFLEFQEFGPAGKDGVPGTADDLANPLESVGYTTYPEREKAFARVRVAAGDDAAASRLRAMTYVYAGHPAEALKAFAETFRRSRADAYPMLATVQELIVIGVRGVQGHPADLERFYDFVRCGPAGPDGKLGTADDLKDPFAALGLPPRIPADDGGLVPPADAPRKVLVELRGALEMMAVAEREDTQFRQSIFLTLERVHTALDDWGAKGQADWYLKLLPDAANNEYEYSTVLVGAQAAARGCDLHFGNVAEFWRQVDALYPGERLMNAGQVRGVRGSFVETLKLLEKPQSVAPRLPAMK